SAVAFRPANRTRCGLRRLAGRGALQRLARARRRRRANGVQNSATPAAELGTRGGDLGGELSPLGSATPRRTVFRVGSPCTVGQSFGQQKASTTPTAWPKLTQSLTHVMGDIRGGRQRPSAW